jgi:hypothetical protein
MENTNSCCHPRFPILLKLKFLVPRIVGLCFIHQSILGPMVLDSDWGRYIELYIYWLFSGEICDYRIKIHIYLLTLSIIRKILWERTVNKIRFCNYLFTTYADFIFHSSIQILSKGKRVFCLVWYMPCATKMRLSQYFLASLFLSYAVLITNNNVICRRLKFINFGHLCPVRDCQRRAARAWAVVNNEQASICNLFTTLHNSVQVPKRVLWEYWCTNINEEQ